MEGDSYAMDLDHHIVHRLFVHIRISHLAQYHHGIIVERDSGLLIALHRDGYLAPVVEEAGDLILAGIQDKGDHVRDHAIAEDGHIAAGR